MQGNVPKYESGMGMKQASSKQQEPGATKQAQSARANIMSVKIQTPHSLSIIKYIRSFISLLSSRKWPESKWIFCFFPLLLLAFPFLALRCGSGFSLRLRRLQKLGRPGISEGPEKEREGGSDEKSAVRIPSAAIARKCIECI